MQDRFFLSLLLTGEFIFFCRGCVSVALAVSVLVFIGSLFITGAFRYLPNHILTMTKRASFYITGSSNNTLPIVPIEL
jgi:hypothetical protein